MAPAFNFVCASVVGFLILGLITIAGFVGTIHFMINICNWNSRKCWPAYTSNSKATKSEPRSEKAKISKLFQLLCLLLMCSGCIEFIIILTGYFVFSRLVDWDGTIFSVLTVMFHGFGVFLLSMLFVLRLYATLKGSMYNYSSKVYKLILIISCVNLIFGETSVILLGTNNLLEDIYDDSEWLIPIIPEIIAQITVMVTLFAHVILQFVLVVLLVKALKSV